MGKSTILIIDTDTNTIDILNKTLRFDYNVIVVNDGRDALDVLAGQDRVDVVLTNIFTPPLQGWQMLHQIYKRRYADIPVIAMSNVTDYRMERKALAEGAWDFVSKPVNPDIVLSRLKNAITKSKLNYMEKLQHSYEHDRLTGLYNRSMLFKEINKVLQEPLTEKYVFVCLDIDKFHLYNASMGEDEGDELIVFISKLVERYCGDVEKCVYGRLEAEVFCAFLPYCQGELETKLQEIVTLIADYRDDYAIEPSVGVYVVDEESPIVENMLSRAKMAAQKCKNKYKTYIGYYDRGMDKQNTMEQDIVNNMGKALANEEFKVYVQPKYNIQVNEPCGGEALVRWESPEKGIISPSVFIPIFESNGFIVKLDYYMWENTCKLLKKQKEESNRLLPVSVNISRISLYNPNVVDILQELVEKYDIEPKYLQLEITESAYMSNPELMRSTLVKLQEVGFLILMDDFGSGYSSLNTLKDIDVDILKIDMECVPKKRESSKSEKILVSILGMANRLGIPTIVEGVETEEQKDFLKDMGCVYVQGFYYSRPLPQREYEELIIKYLTEKPFNENVHDMVSMAQNSVDDETTFYIKEIKGYLNFLKESFDVIRIVDPEITNVLDIDDEDNIVETTYSCFSVWNKKVRCENCSSICAAYQKCQKSKYEFIDNDIFYVISKPLNIVQKNGIMRQCVLEIVSHVSDSILFKKIGDKTTKELLEETQRNAYIDELTGVYNRKYLSDKLFAHHNLNTVASRIGLIFMNINWFKEINAKYSRADGDKVLKTIAQYIESNIAKEDSVIHYSGDEFLIVIINKTKEQVEEIKEKIKDQITNISYDFDSNLKISIAMGVSYISKFDYETININKYIDIADREMYENKSQMKAI